LLFRGKEKWVAQCLEHDIATQAGSLPDLLDMLDHALDAEWAFSDERGLEAFKRLPPAPKKYWDRWEEAYKHQQEERASDMEAWEQMPAHIANIHTAVARGASAHCRAPDMYPVGRSI
jgi:hypothetical protein